MYKLTNAQSIIRVSDGASIPTDPANSDYVVYLSWVAQGNTPIPFPEPSEELKTSQYIAECTLAVEKLLNEKAQERGYDDIKSAAIRAGYPGPFHDEGVKFAQWMDACWAKCYEIMGQVQGGLRAKPTIPQLLAELPEIVL